MRRPGANPIVSTLTAFRGPTHPGCSTSVRARNYCLGTALAQIAVEECVRAVLAADPALRLTEDPADIPWRQVLGRSPARLVVSSERAA